MAAIMLLAEGNRLITNIVDELWSLCVKCPCYNVNVLSTFYVVVVVVVVVVIFGVIVLVFTALHA